MAERKRNNPFNDMPMRTTGAAAIYTPQPWLQNWSMPAAPLGMNIGAVDPRQPAFNSGLPQGYDETDARFGIRQGVGAIARGIGGAFGVAAPVAAVVANPVNALNIFGGQRTVARDAAASVRRAGQSPRQREEAAQQRAAALGRAPAAVSPMGQAMSFFGNFKPNRAQGIGVARDGGARKHTGGDFVAPIGTPVQLQSEAKVLDFGSGGKIGRFIKVQTPDGNTHTIGHLNGKHKDIQKGQVVPAGAVLGWSGISGNASARPGNSVLHVTTRNASGGLVNPFSLTGGGGPGAGSSIGIPSTAGLEAAFGNASSLINKAAAMADAPVSFDITRTARPDRPTPPPVLGPDFAAGDAAFAATRPNNPMDDPKAVQKIQRQEFWSGMARAAMSASGTEHIGTILFKMGAGAMAGKGRAADIIREREEKHDQLMADYNRALANREDGKASSIAQTAQANADRTFQHATNLYSDQLQIWAEKQPKIDGNNVITETPGENGQTRVTVTPIRPIAQMAAMQAQASLGVQAANSLYDAARFETQFRESQRQFAFGAGMQMANFQLAQRRVAIAEQAATLQAAADAQGQLGTMGVASQVARLVQTGGITGLGNMEQMLPALRAEAMTNLGIKVDPLEPNKNLNQDQNLAVNTYLTEKLTKWFVANPEQIKNLYGPTGMVAAAVDQANNRRTMTTSSRGRTSITEVDDGNY